MALIRLETYLLFPLPVSESPPSWQKVLSHVRWQYEAEFQWPNTETNELTDAVLQEKTRFDAREATTKQSCIARTYTSTHALLSFADPFPAVNFSSCQSPRIVQTATGWDFQNNSQLNGLNIYSLNGIFYLCLWFCSFFLVLVIIFSYLT